MSERSSLGVNPATTTSMATLTLEEPGAEHQASPRAAGPLRCGPCALWPRQQTWLCAVPLLMGFVGLGLSLMLLKWIVVGSVQDYVPTDLVDAKGIGQDPFFLSKPSTLPKGLETTTAASSPNGSSSGSSSNPNAATASTGPPVVTGSPSRAANGTASVQRTRAGPPANHTRGRGPGAGGVSEEPRFPNLRVPGSGGTGGMGGGGGVPGSGSVLPTSATITTTTTTTTAPRGSPKESSNRRGGGGAAGAGGAGGGGRNGPPLDTSSTTTTTTTRAVTPTSTAGAPGKPTARWNHGRSSKGPSTTRPHHRFRTRKSTLTHLFSYVMGRMREPGGSERDCQHVCPCVRSKGV